MSASWFGAIFMREPEARHRHGPVVEAQALSAQRMSPRTKAADLHIAAMTPVPRPDRRSIPPPKLHAIEKQARQADLRFAQELDSHRREWQISGSFDPITVPPQDALDAVGNAVLMEGNTNPLRRWAILAVGRGKHVRRSLKETTVAAKNGDMG